MFFSLTLSFFLLHAAWWGIEGGFEVDYGLVFFSTWCNSIASNQWTLILVLSTASWCWVKMSDRWFVDTHIGEALYLCQGLISFLYLVCKCVYYADFMTLNSVFFAENWIVLHAKGKRNLCPYNTSVLFLSQVFILLLPNEIFCNFFLHIYRIRKWNDLACYNICRWFVQPL